MKRVLVAAAGFLVAPLAHAQFGGVVYDPTQSVHAGVQIANEAHSLQFQATEIMEEQEGNMTTAQMLATDVKTLAVGVQMFNTLYAQYNTYKSMMLAPRSLYSRFTSPMSDFYMVNQAANHYSPSGTTLPYINTANTGAGATAAIQLVSIPETTMISYPNLSAAGQQQLTAQGATVDINDSLASTNLQAIGTIRANQQARLTDIGNLETATANQDPTATTQMAVLMRINQALLLQLRSMQDANQIAANSALQQTLVQKQQQDNMKAAFRDAAGYQDYYTNNISTTSSGAANLLTNAPY